jgi:predicted unusual protein kinase regulating ubiquinone biosynthesis (AarF/ABC1/UbiB family)
MVRRPGGRSDGGEPAVSEKDPLLVGATRAKRALATGRVAGSGLRLAARRLLKREGPVDGLIGQALADELDRMKGMAMKVGQILSYFEGILPEDTHAALRVLQQGVTTLPYERVEDVLQEAFGRPVEDLFERFEPDPVAGASIGQVHRAWYRGEPVAVKIQYPGIVESIDGDFSRLGGFSRLVSLGTAVDGRPMADEMRERVRLECDYLLEATAQEAFRIAFGADQRVEIPPVILERTCSNVITTGWADGRDLYELASQVSAEERNEAGLVLLRFAYRSLFELGVVNADPHPGNYIFPEGGPVIFIDFGCTRPFSPSFLEAERNMMKVVIEDRRKDFRDALMATGMVARERGFDFDLHWRTLCHQYAPYRSDEFEFTLGYVREAMEFSGPTNPNLRKIAIAPEWIWLQRLQWGLHAVLARLGVRGSFAPLMRELVALEPAPLTVADPGFPI